MPRDRYRAWTLSGGATRWPRFPTACVEFALVAYFARPGGNATDVHVLNTTPRDGVTKGVTDGPHRAALACIPMHMTRQSSTRTSGEHDWGNRHRSRGI